MSKSASSRDIDFLLAPVATDRPIVYVYRTGALCRQMRRHIKSALLGGGRELSWIAPNQLAEYILSLDVLGIKPAAGSDLGASNHLQKVVVEDVSAADRTVATLFVDERNPIRTGETWASVLEKSVVVDEVQASRRNLKALLRYLERSSDLKDTNGLALPPEVMEHLGDLAEEGDLWTLIAEFDMAKSAARSGANGSTGGSLASVGRASRPHMIRQLSRPDEYTADWLAAEILTHLGTGGTRTQLVREICGGARRLIESEHRKLAVDSARQRASSAVAPRQVIGIVIGLLRWLEKLSRRANWQDTTFGAEPLIVSLHEFVQNIATSTVNPSTPHDYLARLEELRRADESAVLSSHYEVLVGQLHAYVKALSLRVGGDWVSTLVRRLTPPIEAPPAHDNTAPNAYSLSPKPTRHLESYGRASMVLRGLIALKQFDLPIMMQGKEEDHLRDFAASFAKAVLCSASVNGDACDSCESCRQFEAGSHLGYVPPVDVSGRLADERVAAIVARSRTGTLADRTAVVLDRVSRSQPATLDRVLKTIEDPPKGFTFVLLATDMSKIKRSILSRLHVVRLRGTVGMVADLK